MKKMEQEALLPLINENTFERVLRDENFVSLRDLVLARIMDVAIESVQGNVMRVTKIEQGIELILALNDVEVIDLIIYNRFQKTHEINFYPFMNLQQKELEIASKKYYCTRRVIVFLDNHNVLGGEDYECERFIYQSSTRELSEYPELYYIDLVTCLKNSTNLSFDQYNNYEQLARMLVIAS